MPTTPTQQPDVPLPPGAVCTDIWEYDERVVQGADRIIGGEGLPVVVSTAVVQRIDGSIVNDGGHDEPHVNLARGGDTGLPLIDTGINLSSEQARQLAEVLLEAAEELDLWVGR